jgi:hypothetical protein
VALDVGRAYRALGENKSPGATHAFIQVDGLQKWAALSCGSYEGEAPPVVGGEPGRVEDCLPFFDDLDNPEDIPGFGIVDATPVAPELTAFDQAVNQACGVPGKSVSRAEFEALFIAHPAVLERIAEFTGGRVFADRPQPANSAAYLDDLTDAWFAIHGFGHIFCGEPAPGGSIGGLHFRGRYLQLQEQELACRLPNNRGNEEIVPGTIYTLGVIMQVNGATARQSMKGYGLTLSAEDIFKVVTRGFAENPTQSSSSQGCLLTVEDEGARFVTVFVRRKQGVRTFFPDATPDRGRNPDCAAEIVVAGGESGPVSSNTAPVVSRSLSVRTLSAGALTELPVRADTFTDPDGDTLSLSATRADGSPLPDWADFDSERGVLLLLPEPEDAGTRLTIVITASDGQTQVCDSVTVEVAEGN